MFNGLPVSSLQFRSIAPDFDNGMVQEWNLAIQHQFPGNMALEVGYLGNHQSHQLLQPDPNSCPNVYVFPSAQIATTTGFIPISAPSRARRALVLATTMR